MSYCVNCGVELDKTANKCPLCGAEISNPLQPKDTLSPTPYPKPEILLSKTDKRYAASMLSIILLLLSTLCVLLNTIYFNGIVWSVYPVGAFIIVLIFSVPPLLYKASILAFISIDSTAVLVYLYLIEKVGLGYGWFYNIALPVVLSIFVSFTILHFYVLTIRPGKLLFTSVLFFLIGLISICVDVSVENYLEQSQKLSWSLIVMACCLAISIALYATNRNMYIKGELKKRLHL